MVTVVCCLLISILICTPDTLRATTWSCTNAGFEVDTPNGWAGVISPSKASVELESAEDDELTVTIQAKKSNKRIGGNQIVSMFKKRWKQIQAEYPKSVITRKPGRTIVGEFKAIRYSFRYRNFLNMVMDETTIWFNAERNETTLKSRIEVKGPAKAAKIEGSNIEGIIASFRFIAEEEEPPATVDDPISTTAYVPSSNDEERTDSSGSNTDTVKTPLTYASSNTKERSGTLVRRTFKPRQLAKKRDFNPAGLMSNAKLITDGEKLAQYQKTFQDRNTVRTDEQKASARTYSAGFNNADVTK